MDEYIKRDVAMAEIGVLISRVKRNPYDSKEEQRGVIHAFVAVLDMMDRMPTVEVRHGKWRFRKSWDFFVCSECSYEHANYSHYCPNCGAKMDGGNDG